MSVEDVHALEPEDFLAEVQSFEHWFEAVEGYLHGLDHGHLHGLEETPLDPAARERLVAIICSYTVAETAALEASSGLIRIAPNRHAKIFLSTQTVDEGRHVEAMLHRLRELGVTDPEAEVDRRAGSSVKKLCAKILELVTANEWEAAIFAQNVALEAMEYTVFRTHARTADPITRDLLERVLRDERRHIGFGENELGRRLRQGPQRLRLRLEAVKAELDALVLDTFDEAMDEIGVARSDRPSLGRDYLETVARLGLV